MLCVHCHAIEASRPRGLCWRDYYTPGVRALYPVAANCVPGSAVPPATPRKRLGFATQRRADGRWDMVEVYIADELVSRRPVSTHDTEHQAEAAIRQRVPEPEEDDEPPRIIKSHYRPRKKPQGATR